MTVKDGDSYIFLLPFPSPNTRRGSIHKKGRSLSKVQTTNRWNKCLRGDRLEFWNRYEINVLKFFKKWIIRIRKGLFTDKWQKVVESDYIVIQRIADWQKGNRDSMYIWRLVTRKWTFSCVCLQRLRVLSKPGMCMSMWVYKLLQTHTYFLTWRGNIMFLN